MTNRYEGSSTYQNTVQSLGEGVTYRETTVNIDVNPFMVLQNNPRRLLALVSNASSNSVTIGFSPALSFGNGIVLTAGGGNVVLNVSEDGELCSTPVYAVGSVATGVLYVLEVYTV